MSAAASFIPVFAVMLTVLLVHVRGLHQPKDLKARKRRQS
jgi:hypothetical protein